MNRSTSRLQASLSERSGVTRAADRMARAPAKSLSSCSQPCNEVLDDGICITAEALRRIELREHLVALRLPPVRQRQYHCLLVIEEPVHRADRHLGPAGDRLHCGRLEPDLVEELSRPRSRSAPGWRGSASAGPGLERVGQPAWLLSWSIDHYRSRDTAVEKCLEPIGDLRTVAGPGGDEELSLGGSLRARGADHGLGRLTLLCHGRQPLR